LSGSLTDNNHRSLPVPLPRCSPHSRPGSFPHSSAENLVRYLQSFPASNEEGRGGCPGIIPSLSNLEGGPGVVLTGGWGVLECTWERRAWSATFPIGRHMLMYETGDDDTKSRLSA